LKRQNRKKYVHKLILVANKLGAVLMIKKSQSMMYDCLRDIDILIRNSDIYEFTKSFCSTITSEFSLTIFSFVRNEYSIQLKCFSPVGIIYFDILPSLTVRGIDICLLCNMRYTMLEDKVRILEYTSLSRYSSIRKYILCNQGKLSAWKVLAEKRTNFFFHKCRFLYLFHLIIISSKENGYIKTILGFTKHYWFVIVRHFRPPGVILITNFKKSNDFTNGISNKMHFQVLYKKNISIQESLHVLRYMYLGICIISKETPLVIRKLTDSVVNASSEELFIECLKQRASLRLSLFLDKNNQW